VSCLDASQRCGFLRLENCSSFISFTFLPQLPDLVPSTASYYLGTIAPSLVSLMRYYQDDSKPCGLPQCPLDTAETYMFFLCSQWVASPSHLCCATSLSSFLFYFFSGTESRKSAAWAHTQKRKERPVGFSLLVCGSPRNPFLGFGILGMRMQVRMRSLQLPKQKMKYVFSRLITSCIKNSSPGLAYTGHGRWWCRGNWVGSSAS
jgi:hypothetical protein